MVCFFLSLLKQKLPQRCPKQGGGRGVKATFGQCPKGSSFFFRITSLRNIFDIEDKQKEAVTEFMERIKVRDSLLADSASQGIILDTSTPAGAGRAGSRNMGTVSLHITTSSVT